MTEEEHIKLTEVGDSFFEGFGELVAKHVCKMPEHLHADTLGYLQDMASVYGSCYSKFISNGRFNHD